MNDSPKEGTRKETKKSNLQKNNNEIYKKNMILLGINDF